MKRGVVTLILLLLSALAIAQEDSELFTAQEMILALDMDGSINIQPETSNWAVDYVNADLHMYPRESSRQTVLSQTTNPKAILINDTLRYRWENPKTQNLDFSLDAEVRTKYHMPKLTREITFPTKIDEMQQYLQPTENIDSDNEAVIAQASILAEGETDLYILENKMAAWVRRDIEYNLSTLTAEVSQPASWVLQNRYGVCDELTNLFIAMNRALGIPARFVSGVSYTNSPLFPEPWGAHAWAEVYIPEVGWVPYDITYGEFGWLDPTHIELMYGVGSIEPSTSFEWLARNIKLTPGELNIEANIIDTEGTAGKPIDIKLESLDKEIGFGSYTLMEAKLDNKAGYYVPMTVFLSRVSDTEILTPNPVSIVLKPNEEKSVYWMVKLDESLKKGFIYTFPFRAYTLEGKSDDFELKSEENEIKYSYEDIKQLYDAKQEEITKTYSARLTVGCSSDKSFVYVGDKAKISCVLKNSGTKILKNLKVCLLDDCDTTQLGINQERDFDFEFAPSKITDKAILNIKNSDVTKTEQVDIDVLDKPDVEIQNLTFPSNVKYDDIFMTEFRISKKSLSDIEELKIRIYDEKLEKKLVIKNLTKYEDFDIEIYGSDLDPGRNEFKIVLEWQDKEGIYYQEQESFTIELIDVSFAQRIKIFFRNISEALFGR